MEKGTTCAGIKIDTRGMPEPREDGHLRKVDTPVGKPHVHLTMGHDCSELSFRREPAAPPRGDASIPALPGRFFQHFTARDGDETPGVWLNTASLNSPWRDRAGS
jgi:hypothetical protein